MADVFDPEQRSAVMRAVRGANTGPELIVRRTAHALGFRFRLQRKDLPGKPDLVFPKLRLALFVHGCFWHGHHCDRGARVPQTNRDYWLAKIERNKTRDARTLEQLAEIGWDSTVIWECETRDRDTLEMRLRHELSRRNRLLTRP